MHSLNPVDYPKMCKTSYLKYYKINKTRRCNALGALQDNLLRGGQSLGCHIPVCVTFLGITHSCVCHIHVYVEFLSEWVHLVQLSALVGWLIVQQHVNTKSSICANSGGGKPAQSAKDANEIQCILSYVTR